MREMSVFWRTLQARGWQKKQRGVKIVWAMFDFRVNKDLDGSNLPAPGNEVEFLCAQNKDKLDQG